MRSEPHIEQKQRPRKKLPSKYKENIKRYNRNNASDLTPYAYRSENRKRSHINSSIRHIHTIRTQATPALRAQYARLSRSNRRYKNLRKGNTKRCSICGMIKAISDFDKRKDKARQQAAVRPYCYLCRKKMNAEAYRRRKQNDT